MPNHGDSKRRLIEQLERSERFRVLLDAPDFVVLHRNGTSPGGDTSDRVLMAGEILSTSTVLDMINTITASRWVGTLHIYGADSHRALGFDRGVLSNATSDDPSDRLDKVLFRLGVLSPAEVESVLRVQRADRRFGELLVERGLISRRQLFGYLQQQMQEILFASVLESEGSYLFTVSSAAGGDVKRPAPATSVHIPVAPLLLPAAERLDRMAEAARLVPRLDHCPQVQPGVEMTKLEAKARLVLGYCDGIRSVRQIASDTWLGVFETSEVVYDLIRRRAIELILPRRSAREAAETLIEPYNRLLRRIHHAVEARGQLDRLRQEITSWIAEASHSELDETAFDESGFLAVDAFEESLGQNASRHQLEAMRNALHDLIAYGLFSASTWLPRDEERVLSAQVHRGLRDIG